MHRILLVLLILPLALWIVVPDQGAVALENRARAQMPDAPTDLGSAPEFFTGMDSFVSDNIGLRDQLIAVKNAFDRMLNRLSNDQVIAGQNGWLFYNAHAVIERNTGVDFDPARVDRIVAYTQEAHDLAQSVGAEFVSIVVPNSHEVYSHQLPNWAQPDGDPLIERDAIVEASRAADIATIDPSDLYAPLDIESEPVYYRRDTHWNNYGAYLAYYEAMSQLGLSDDLPTPQEFLLGYSEGEYYGVLDVFAGLSEAAESEPLPDLDMSVFTGFAEQSFEEFDDHVSMDSFRVTYAPDRPRLLVIGNSFTYSFFRNYWGASFSEVHWAHNDFGRYDRSIFERFNPDYVIFQLVDWELPAWVPYDMRLDANN